MEKDSCVSQEVYEALKKDIMAMKLLPGQLLMTQHLSEQYGASRTPVREALIRLAEIDFVEKIGGGKFRVKEITWKMVVDLYKMRIILETAAMDSIVNTISEEQIKEFEQYTDNMSTAFAENDYFEYFENDMAFHNLILRIYDNQMLLNLMHRVDDYQQRIRFLTMSLESRMQAAISEHREIVKCMREHDTVGSKNILYRHLEQTVKDIDMQGHDGYNTWSSILKW